MTMPASVRGNPDLARRWLDLQRQQNAARLNGLDWTRLPVEWVERRSRYELWSAQKTILESVRDHRRTAVHSGHAVSKSMTAALCAAWWIDAHPPGEAFLVTSAPSWPQVRAILWRYIGRIHRQGGLAGVVNQTEWKIGKELVGFGRKPPDREIEDMFQGIHARYVFVVLDEAGGIPGELWENANKLLTTEECRLLVVGNPDARGTQFWKACQPGSGFNVIHIGAHNTPNFTGERLPAGAALVDQTFLDDTARDFGVDSVQWKRMVLGDFPDDRTDGVVPWSAIDAAQKRVLVPDAGDLIVLGVDVGASDDGDETVVAVRHGNKFLKSRPVQSADPQRIVDHISVAVHELEPWAVHIDSIGVGFGIAGMLRERFPQLPVLDINVAAASTAVNRAGKPRFANLRAEVWWRMREKIAGYDFRELDALTLEQLGDTRWFENQRGLIQCEPKDAVRRRTGRSPDRADAVLLAAWEPAVGSFQRPAAGKLVVGTPAVPSKRGQAGGKLGVGSAVRQR